MKRHSTDKYGAIVPAPVSRRGCAVPREHCSGPPQAIAVSRRLDPPPAPALDAGETERAREHRLALARARFVHDERERARRSALNERASDESTRPTVQIEGAS